MLMAWHHQYILFPTTNVKCHFVYCDCENGRKESIFSLWWISVWKLWVWWDVGFAYVKKLFFEFLMKHLRFEFTFYTSLWNIFPFICSCLYVQKFERNFSSSGHGRKGKVIYVESFETKGENTWSKTFILKTYQKRIHFTYDINIDRFPD